MLYCIIRYCILALAYTRPALELLLTLPGPRRPTSLCKTEVHRRVAIIMILIIIMIIISISIVVSRSLFGCILSLLSPVLACCQSSSYYMKCPFTLVKDRRFINLRRRYATSDVTTGSCAQGVLKRLATYCRSYGLSRTRDSCATCLALFHSS